MQAQMSLGHNSDKWIEVADLKLISRKTWRQLVHLTMSYEREIVSFPSILPPPNPQRDPNLDTGPLPRSSNKRARVDK